MFAKRAAPTVDKMARLWHILFKEGMVKDNLVCPHEDLIYLFSYLALIVYFI